MVTNYLKLARRNLLTNKFATFINLAGLAAGMAVAVLICLWIWDEISFNHYHKNYKQIALAMSVETINGVTTAENYASVPLAQALRQASNGDFEKVSLVAQTSQLMKVGDKKLSETGLWAQPDFPVMFTLKMLQGSQHALRDPSSILLSESTAKTLFGNSEPIGQAIVLGDAISAQVAGVYEDIPGQSDFSGTQFLLAWDNESNAGAQLTNDWLDHHFQVFVQLGKDTRIEQVNARIRDITKPHVKGAWEEIMLHPMDKWMLYDKFENGKMVAGRMHFVWMFGIICSFVLLLACINYMNLSTARSEKRAREVGVRKVLGAAKQDLIKQFLGESLLLTFMALGLALVVAQLSLPYFNTLAEKEVTIPYAQPIFWLMLLGFVIGTGLPAGSYPAFYLSRFQPVKVLKGTFRAGRAGVRARQLLVITQFTVSIALIIATVIIYRQVQFARARPVGYSREGLVTVSMNNKQLQQQFDALRNDLLATAAVTSVAVSSSPSTDVQNSMLGYDWDGRDPNSVPIIGTLFVNESYGKTIGWHILEGRDFSNDFLADSGALILNEAAVAFTGLKNPVGKNIRWHGRQNPIVGVVKDMVMQSPYTPAMPVFFMLAPNSRIHIISMRINPAVNVHDAIARITPVFKKYRPDAPFEYQFADDRYNLKFAREETIGSLVTLFAVFAIFISCLGLFGLASFIAEQRTREIGVRKILGASVFSIWQLLSKEFVGLVIVSMLIAAPIAYYVMSQWLQDYVYRTALSWWIFTATGLGALLIALLTVSYQAIKAAVANPVKSLRSE
ncbi:MAG: ABC transporter permease [Chitinophagaceae bacterium]